MEAARAWPLRPVGDARLAVAYRQLAQLLDAGLGIIEALRLLLRHSQGRLHRALTAVRAGVERGATLAQAMGTDPDVFPAAVRSLVAAGEASGGLPVVFADLAASLELRLHTRRRIIRAAVYPSILFTLAFFLLPLSKIVTEGAAGYLRASLLPWLEAVALLAVVFIFAPWGLRALLGAGRVALLCRRLPLVGPLFLARARSAFARQLASALRAGLDAITSLLLAGRATADPGFEARIEEAARRVQGGASLEEALARSGLFDEDFLLAVAGGEASGHIAASLEQEARLIDDALLHRLEILVQVAAVFILLLVYAYAGYRIYWEYKRILMLEGENQQELDQLLKELGPGAIPSLE